MPVSRPAAAGRRRAAGKGLSLSSHEGRTAPATARPQCREAGREAGRAELSPGRATPLRGDPRAAANWGFAATEPDWVRLPEQSTRDRAAAPGAPLRLRSAEPVRAGGSAERSGARRAPGVSAAAGIQGTARHPHGWPRQLGREFPRKLCLQLKR